MSRLAMSERLHYWRGVLERLGIRDVDGDAASLARSMPLTHANVSKPKRRCNVEGCTRAPVARGNCHKHYTAARRVAARLIKKPEVMKKVGVRYVARGIVEVLPKAKMRKALGRGVCSSCKEVRPVFAVGKKKAICRECLE